MIEQISAKLMLEKYDKWFDDEGDSFFGDLCEIKEYFDDHPSIDSLLLSNAVLGTWPDVYGYRQCWEDSINCDDAHAFVSDEINALWDKLEEATSKKTDCLYARGDLLAIVHPHDLS